MTAAASTWANVVQTLEAHPPLTIMQVGKRGTPHPRTFLMTPSIGLPVGQSADYRRVLPCGRGFHVRDFGTHYEAHIDEVHPAVDLLEHLRRDSPGTFVAGGAGVGAALGALLGRSKEATLAGALLGALLASVAANTGTKRDKTDC